MKILFKIVFLAIFAISQTGYAASLTVQFDNASATLDTTVNAEFNANIYIDSITDFAGFDLNLAFDTNKLSALTLTSGQIFGADTDVLGNTITPGLVNIAEAIAFSSPATAGLDINAPTLLATVHFKALAVAVNSLLDITNPILSDFSGNSIGGSKQGGFVTIAEAPAAVPLPAAIWLFGSGLLVCLGRRNRR